jgi:protein-S-isoprenylcysteine O-methyltransferase Ste14
MQKKNTTYSSIRIQPPLLALILLALVFVLARLVPLPLAVPPILQASGFLLAMLGLLLGLGALIAFRRTRSTSAPHRAAGKLITAGPYRFSRNPVYLGFVFMLIGLPLDAGTYWGILLAPIMVYLFNRLIIEPEEEYLTQKYGETYRSYRAKVRRWI